jgi:hypothetical protein
MWVEDSSEVEVVEGEGTDDPADTPAGPPSSGIDDASEPTDSTPGKPVGVKKSPRSVRDDPLGNAVTMAVAIKSAELREQTAIKVMQRNVASRERLADQQRELQMVEVERQIQGQVESQQAVGNQARERISSAEVLERTRLFVGAGHPLAETSHRSRAWTP